MRCFTLLYSALLAHALLLCFTLLYSALLLYAGALQAQNPYLLAYLRRWLYICIYISACFTLLHYSA